jgi:hypothetical protein
MGAYFLALIKRKQSQAYVWILDKGFAYNLTVLIGNQI